MPRPFCAVMNCIHISHVHIFLHMRLHRHAVLCVCIINQIFYIHLWPASISLPLCFLLFFTAFPCRMFVLSVYVCPYFPTYTYIQCMYVCMCGRACENVCGRCTVDSLLINSISWHFLLSTAKYFLFFISVIFFFSCPYTYFISWPGCDVMW